MRKHQLKRRTFLTASIAGAALTSCEESKPAHAWEDLAAVMASIQSQSIQDGQQCKDPASGEDLHCGVPWNDSGVFLIVGMPSDWLKFQLWAARNDVDVLGTGWACCRRVWSAFVFHPRLVGHDVAVQSLPDLMIPLKGAA